MANPTALTGNLVIDLTGQAIKVSQLQTSAGVVVYNVAQQSTIADAAINYITNSTFNATFNNTEIETVTNALGTGLNAVAGKVNSILAALENAGILADS